MAGKEGGKKGRKHGRSKRSPGDQRYKVEMRWISNKKKAIARDAKRRARKAAKLHARSIRIATKENSNEA